MSDGTGGIGVENVRSIWSSGSNWLLNESPVEDQKTEIDPNTGEPVFLKIRALTLQEEVFVREYCKTFDVKRTAKALDIKDSTARGMLQRKPVQVSIHKKASQIIKSADMDASWVMQNLREVVERCMDSDNTGKFDAGNALRGLELIGKSMAMFTDKTINETHNKTVIRIESNIGGNIGVSGDVIEVAEEAGLLE